MKSAGAWDAFLGLGIGLLGVGAVFVALSSKPGFGPIGFAFLAMGAVYLVVYGIHKKK